METTTPARATSWIRRGFNELASHSPQCEGNSKTTGRRALIGRGFLASVHLGRLPVCHGRASDATYALLMLRRDAPKNWPSRQLVSIDRPAARKATVPLDLALALQSIDDAVQLDREQAAGVGQVVATTAVRRLCCDIAKACCGLATARR